jgi:hypothetical protein
MFLDDNILHCLLRVLSFYGCDLNTPRPYLWPPLHRFTHRVHILVEMKQGQCICPLSCSVHSNFSGEGKCNERGWACTPHPHQPGQILPSSLNVRQKAAVATLCTLWVYQYQWPMTSLPSVTSDLPRPLRNKRSAYADPPQCCHSCWTPPQQLRYSAMKVRDWIPRGPRSPSFWVPRNLFHHKIRQARDRRYSVC